jgi:pyoverdine/dityrosine biosynthesis protein Dit1
VPLRWREAAVEEVLLAEAEAEAPVGFIAANEQFSFLNVSSSSKNICLHLHSTLQNPLSPLYSTNQEYIQIKKRYKDLGSVQKQEKMKAWRLINASVRSSALLTCTCRYPCQARVSVHKRNTDQEKWGLEKRSVENDF